MSHFTLLQHAGTSFDQMCWTDLIKLNETLDLLLAWRPITTYELMTWLDLTLLSDGLFEHKILHVVITHTIYI